MAVEMKRINQGGGVLRAAGYDERNRTLRVETVRGTFDYANVPNELFRRLMNSPSPANFYRDQIEEEYTGRRV